MLNEILLGPFKLRKTPDRDSNVLLVEAVSSNQKVIFVAGVHLVSRQFFLLPVELMTASVNLNEFSALLKSCLDFLKSWANDVPVDLPHQTKAIDRPLILAHRSGAKVLSSFDETIFLITKLSEDKGSIIQAMPATTDRLVEIRSLVEAVNLV